MIVLVLAAQTCERCGTMYFGLLRRVGSVGPVALCVVCVLELAALMDIDPTALEEVTR